MGWFWKVCLGIVLWMVIPSIPKDKGPAQSSQAPVQVAGAAKMSMKHEPDFVPAPQTINRRIAMRPPVGGGYGGGAR